LYWFHPLVWIAARQSSVAREQACDEAVLALGTRPSAYAQVLLDLADSMQAPAPLAALPMVERSLLETRLMAILNDKRRPAPVRRGLMPALGIAAFTLSLAAAQPAVRAIASAALPAPAPATTLHMTAAAGTETHLTADSACWWDSSTGSSFSGTMST